MEIEQQIIKLYFALAKPWNRKEKEHFMK